jgi:alpha-mannosidase
MNNHWGTNYRAFQEGPVTFRFVLRPHAIYDAAEASRAAIAASQPLLAVRAHGAPPPAAPRLAIESPDVIVTALKPSDDGRALIVRLWNAGGRDVRTTVRWSAPAPRRVTLSGTDEQPGRELGDTIELPAWGALTLRAELP